MPEQAASLLRADSVRRVLQHMHHAVAASPIHPLDNFTTQLRHDSMTVVFQPNRSLSYLLVNDEEHYLCGGKQRNALRLLSSAMLLLADPHRLGECRRTLGAAWPSIPPLPDSAVAFDFRQGSSGCHKYKEGGRCYAVPTLVIAHSPDHNGTRGILSPNPYFESLPEWAATMAPVMAAAKRRPVNQRGERSDWRALWRGGISRNTTAGEAGTKERLQAASLSARYPELFDVRIEEDKLRTIRPDPGFDDPDATELLDPNSAAFERASYKKEDKLSLEEYTQSPALVNLPGSTKGSYSRNLNHLWGAGAAVLLWNGEGARNDFAGALYREWYYDALDNGTTHLEIDRDSAPHVVAQLLAPSAEAAARRSALAEAAAKVYATFLCPCCLAAYYSHLLNEIAKAQRGWSGSHELKHRMDAYARAVGGKFRSVSAAIVEGTKSAKDKCHA